VVQGGSDGYASLDLVGEGHIAECLGRAGGRGGSQGPRCPLCPRPRFLRRPRHSRILGTQSLILPRFCLSPSLGLRLSSSRSLSLSNNSVDLCLEDEGGLCRIIYRPAPTPVFVR
jgi:hypothetical protein